MEKVKVILAAVLLALFVAGCTPEDPEGIPGKEEVSYPVILAESDDAVVVLVGEGEDPRAFLSIRRKPSEQLSSYCIEINGEPVTEDSITADLGPVWDDDRIKPEGELDNFSVSVPERGRITVTLSALYGGNEYNNAITYVYE